MPPLYYLGLAIVTVFFFVMLAIAYTPFRPLQMKTDWTHLEKNRVIKGPLASEPGKPYGMFAFPTGINGNDRLRVVAADATACPPEDIGHGWEHVSISALRAPKHRGLPFVPRWPTPEEVTRIKRKFWEDTETVLQFHPPEDVRANFTPYAVHLWLCTTKEQPLPPPIAMGPPPAPTEPQPAPDHPPVEAA